MNPADRDEIDRIIARGSRRARRERTERHAGAVATVLTVALVLALCALGVRNCARCWSDAGRTDVRCAGAFTGGGGR